MTLTAIGLGLGSLWICDSFFAQQELNEWLGNDGEYGELYAVLAVGYADEDPAARPRKSVEEVVEWRKAFTVENAAKIACEQVLGTYKVIFDRAQDE